MEKTYSWGIRLQNGPTSLYFSFALDGFKSVFTQGTLEEQG